MKKLFLISLVSLVLFSMVATVMAYDCEPAACDYGYTDLGITCKSLVDKHYNCDRSCFLPEHCGTYGPFNEKQSKSIENPASGSTYQGWSWTASSTMCTKYRAETTIRVGDWVVWPVTNGCGTANSFELTANQGFSGNHACLTCQPSKDFMIYSDTREATKGQTLSTTGRYQAFGKSGCLPGDPVVKPKVTYMFLDLMVAEAPIIPAETKKVNCQGDYECVKNSHCGIDSWSGSPYCSNGNVMQMYTLNTCTNHQCGQDQEERTKKTCGVNGCDDATGDCRPVCQEAWLGTPYCQGTNEVWQTFRKVSCSEEATLKTTCTGNTKCTNGACQELQCNCDAPGQWGPCVNNKQERIKYDCSASTGFQCIQTTEQQACNGPCTETCTGKSCGTACGVSCGTCPTGQTCTTSGQCTSNPVTCTTDGDCAVGYVCNTGTHVCEPETPPINWLLIIGIGVGILAVIVGFVYVFKFLLRRAR